MKLYKWRAVYVEIQKESPRKGDAAAPGGEGAPGAETIEISSVAATGVGAPGADTIEVSSIDSEEDLICDDAILLLLQMQTARDLAANILPGPPPTSPVPIPIGSQLEEQIAKNLEEMCSSSQPDVPVPRTAANLESTATVPSSISSRPEVPRSANLESTVNVPGSILSTTAIPFAASVASQPTAKVPCPICGPLICWCNNH